jgi:hypothetical protein
VSLLYTHSLPPYCCPSGKGTAPVAFNEEGVHIAAGQRQAFYVHCTDHMTAVSFVNRPLAEDGSILREVSQHGNFTD